MSYPDSPVSLEHYASSVSSTDTTPTPPRPDSPRLNFSDSTAVRRARLNQLQVWSHIAEDVHNDDDPIDDPVPITDLLPSTRLADRTRSSSYSIHAQGPAFTRRKSLFVPRPKTTLNMAPTNVWNRSNSRNANTSLTRLKRSSSFHRYARVSGFEKPKRWNIEVFGDDFDDLDEGLDATKVTETPIQPQC